MTLRYIYWVLYCSSGLLMAIVFAIIAHYIGNYRSRSEKE